MTSGKPLTEQQRDAILRLAGKVDADGEFLLSMRQIADALEIHERTVRRWIRQAAVSYGVCTAWRDSSE